MVGSAPSRRSLGKYDLEVNVHSKTSVCSHNFHDGLIRHWYHGSDDHFRRQSLTSSLRDTNHYWLRLESKF